MIYDSEEQKEQDKSIAEKLKHAREFAANPNNMEIMLSYMNKVQPILKAMNEKVHAGEQLTDEEFLFLNENDKFLKQMLQSISDMNEVINTSLMVQTDAIFHQVSKLAKQGNEEAKKVYEVLLPEYKKAHGLDSEEPADNN